MKKSSSNIVQDGKTEAGEGRIAIVLHVIIMVVILAVVLIVNATIQVAFTIQVLWLLFGLVAISLILALRGQLAFGRILMPVLLIAGLTVILYRGNGLHDTATAGFSTIILLGGMLIGRRGLLPFAGLCAGALTFVGLSEMNGWITNPYSGDTGWEDILIQASLLSASAGMLNLLMKRMHENLQRAQDNELALQRSEEMYRRAIISAGAVPYYLDHRVRKYTFMGEGILSMTGYTAAEMHPDLWESLEQEGFPRGGLVHLTYEEADRLTEEDNDIVWECDYRILTRDGQTRWVADTSVKGLNEFGERVGVIGILQDITDRKNALLERERLIKDLEARNAELERFTYTVSHDLKSPLVTIQGYLGYIELDARKGNLERLQKDLQRVRDATVRMQALLNDLLELSRIGRMTNPMEDTPMSGIVQEALNNVAGQIAARNVSVQIAEDLPVVRVDRARLVEVFQNLIDNACKYMGVQPKPHIKIGLRAGEGERIFYVRDNGIGIEPQFHEKVFGLFNKLDPESEGTGIGLALVKRIIEVHGGKIWVESDGMGKGSTFCFTLPEDRM
jgi:PAS domain S-box-containing protein